jgi:Gamma-glutamyl cyclotransferase, AIG2-like
MNSQVVSTLLNRPWPPTDGTVTTARLYGYSRHPVKKCAYPAIIPSTSSSSFVQGLLWKNALSAKEMDMMDWYESDDYHRVQVQVQEYGNDESTTTMAQVYVWREDLMDSLHLDREWSYEQFCQESLESYMERTVQPCRVGMERLGMTDDSTSNTK